MDLRDIHKSNPLPIAPILTQGGHITVQTNGVTGANYTAFENRACTQLTIMNDTGTKLEVQQGGAGAAFPILDGQYFPFFGITNANQISVRRADTSTTQVTVKARWEA